MFFGFTKHLFFPLKYFFKYLVTTQTECNCKMTLKCILVISDKYYTLIENIGYVRHWKNVLTSNNLFSYYVLWQPVSTKINLTFSNSVSIEF